VTAGLDPRALAAARLGVFGGSFDPVHRGHLNAAAQAERAFGLDHVLCVPAARSPHKQHEGAASPADRLELLRLALEHEPRRSVWTYELERPAPSYTVDALEQLARLRAGRGELFLVLGADQLERLHEWRALERVLELARPIAIARPGWSQDTTALAQRLPASALAQLEAGRVEGELVDVSASDLRERLARGEDVSELVPPRVLAAIHARGLYGSSVREARG